MSAEDGKIHAAIAALNNDLNLDAHLGCIVEFDDERQGKGPRASLLYLRFSEDRPNVEAFAAFLWAQCMYYALPRKKRLKFLQRINEDFSQVALANQAVRDAFITFNRLHPSRASEFGEVLAYCIAQKKLGAAQIASKMALKTSANMPIHGLDGVHAIFDSNGLTVYFLESKVAASANDGIRDYVSSSESFINNRVQYLREYQLVFAT
ncbi:MAG TPA: DUF1837 domain-containing protein [Paenirhodobacter sp.]